MKIKLVMFNFCRKKSQKDDGLNTLFNGVSCLILSTVFVNRARLCATYILFLHQTDALS